jgi:hypothetical protein
MSKKNFISSILEYKKINKNQASKLLGWTPQYLNYLCNHAKMINTEDIPHIASKLDVSKTKIMTFLEECIFNKK